MTEVLPIDAYVVSLDSTHNFMFDPKDRPFIKAIHSVYLFDRNRRVHCCEMTASYEMLFVCDQITYNCELSDKRRDQLDMKYGYCGGEPKYIHCHSIDAIVEANKPFTVHHYGDTQVSFDDVEYDAQMESLIEHFNCNQVL